MLIEIRVLARLFRIPLLRVEGVVAIRDAAGAATESQGLGASGRGGRPSSAIGRDLAVAEAIMAELGTQRGPGSGRSPADRS